MQDSRYAPRRALRAALGLGAIAASLAFAGAASAAVITVVPDGSNNTDNLGAAINAANTNGSTSNTIVLPPGVYTPGASTTALPYTITKNLTIVADHSFQCPVGQVNCIEINGAAGNLAHGPANMFVIPAGVSVRIDGINIDAGGGAIPLAEIADNGNLTMWGDMLEGAIGYAVNVGSTGTATLNETTVNGDQSDALFDGGNMTLNNVSVTSGQGSGIDTQTPYTLQMNNTLLAFQIATECTPSGVTSGGATDASLDDDGSCGVQFANPGIDSSFPLSSQTNGGPTSSVEVPSNSLTTGQGVNCPTVDQRFFANPVVGGARQCDIGAVTDSATQETAPPSCTVTGLIAGPPKQQQVSLTDSLSGVGPEPGPATDNPSNAVATAYPPPAAVPVFGYSADNLQINNGSVAFTPPAAPSTSPMVLTATKTTQTSGTQWSFTGLNWAGISKNCF